MRNVARSIGDLVSRAGRVWAVTIVGGVLGLIAAIERAVTPVPPGWEWVVDALNAIWLPVFLGGVPLALFAAYHSLRMSEEDARKRLDDARERQGQRRRATTVRKTPTRTVFESQGLSGAAHERLMLRVLDDDTGDLIGSTVDQVPAEPSEDISA